MAQTWTVEVSSAYGGCDPSAGSYVWTNGQTMTCGLTNNALVMGDTQYVCQGWTGAGSVSNGTGSNVQFAVTENSTITWQWTTQFWWQASAGAHGSVQGTASSWQEWMCGTVPTNQGSRFEFSGDASTGDGLVFCWSPAVSGRVYRVMGSDTLDTAFTNMAVISNSVNCWTGIVDGGRAFYRVKVEGF